MKTSKSNLKKLFSNREFLIDLSIWTGLIVASLVLLGILVGTHVNGVHWNWITGFIIGAFFSTLALWLIRISVKLLVKTENYYFYIFLFISRIGLYFIPFLLAIFIPNDVFKIYGVLWGFIPLVCVPLSGVIPAVHDAFSKNRLLSQA